MLTMLGTPRRCCDGITRRESLQAGALAALGGLGLPDVLRAEGNRRPDAPPAKAKNVILLFLMGGAASQLGRRQVSDPPSAWQVSALPHGPLCAVIVPGCAAGPPSPPATSGPRASRPRRAPAAEALQGSRSVPGLAV